jgi:hypothetical protein
VSNGAQVAPRQTLRTAEPYFSSYLQWFVNNWAYHDNGLLDWAAVKG